MKKLMIAAAVAAMTAGAFAESTCGGLGEDQVNNPQVYKYTFSGKTTKGLDGTSTDPANCGGLGGDTGCYKRIPAKLKIKGWLAYCDDVTCNAFNTGSAGATYQAFWMLKPYKLGFGDTGVEIAQLANVIGKKPNKAEVFGTFAGTAVIDAENDNVWDLGTIYFAGLGKYKSSKAAYSSLSGNFAGQPAASWYIKLKGNTPVCKQTDVYDCTNLKMVCEAYPTTVAFGKWSVKYSKSASKKLAKTNAKLPKAPSYATVLGVEGGEANP